MLSHQNPTPDSSQNSEMNEMVQLIASLNLAARDSFSSEENKRLAKEVLEKSRIGDLYAALCLRNNDAKFEDIINESFLNEVKKSDNPIVAFTVVGSLTKIAELPLMKSPAIIGGARKYRDEWQLILQRQSGLFGYFVRLLDLTGKLRNIVCSERGCDELLQTLCSIKIIYDLHKEEHSRLLISLLSSVVDLTKTNQLPPPSASSPLVFGNVTPKEEEIQNMMMTILSIDANNHLILNEAYISQVLQYVQNYVRLDHMQNQHKVGTLHGYQLRMWDASIKQLKSLDILSANEEEKIRRDYFVM